MLKVLPRVPQANQLLARREDLPPQDLRHSDSLRITLKAFSDVFHLHLEPNNDLLHPTAARIEYFKPSPDGRGTVLDRVEPIQRESVLVYGGKVIHDDHTQKALAEGTAGGVWRPYGVKSPGERGWARIMVYDPGNPDTGRPAVFEGAFSVDGVIHHVNTKDNYQRTRLDLDPEPLQDTELVVFRDSDLLTTAEEEHIRTGKPPHLAGQKRPPTTCAHDRLGYNVAKSNPVLRYGAGLDRVSQDWSWLEPLGLVSPDDSHESANASLVRRQGDINNAGGESSGNFVDSIGQTAGCPITQQIVSRPSWTRGFLAGSRWGSCIDCACHQVYMGVVSDCTYTQQNGGSTNATQQILKNFNTVSLLYKVSGNPIGRRSRSASS